MYILNCLIGLLYIFKFKPTITYNYSKYLVFLPLYNIMLIVKKYPKVLERFMIKYNNKYNYHIILYITTYKIYVINEIDV